MTCIFLLVVFHLNIFFKKALYKYIIWNLVDCSHGVCVCVRVFASLCSKNGTLVKDISRALTSLTILCPFLFVFLLSYSLIFCNVMNGEKK